MIQLLLMIVLARKIPPTACAPFRSTSQAKRAYEKTFVMMLSVIPVIFLFLSLKLSGVSFLKFHSPGWSFFFHSVAFATVRFAF
jgi:hypothetical protein